MSTEEKKIIEKAIKEGKIVIITGLKDAKINIEPKDRVVVITRK